MAVDLYTLLRIIVRRWYVTVPVLVGVLLNGVDHVGNADPEYKASGSVVLLRYDPTSAEAQTDEEAPPRNPYADFSGSVNITAAVLENIASGDPVRQQVVDNGGTADFTVEQEEEAPILLIEATAATRERAIESVSMIAESLDAELTARQERFEVPDEDRIVLETVLVPETATRLDTARNRALTVVVAFGIAGVIAAAVLAESYEQGRRARRRRRRAAAALTSADDAVAVAPVPNGSQDATPPAGPPRPSDLLDPAAIEAPNGEPATPSPRRSAAQWQRRSATPSKRPPR